MQPSKAYNVKAVYRKFDDTAYPDIYLRDLPVVECANASIEFTEYTDGKQTRAMTTDGDNLALFTQEQRSIVYWQTKYATLQNKVDAIRDKVVELYTKLNYSLLPEEQQNINTNNENARLDDVITMLQTIENDYDQKINDARTIANANAQSTNKDIQEQLDSANKTVEKLTGEITDAEGYLLQEASDLGISTQDIPTNAPLVKKIQFIDASKQTKGFLTWLINLIKKK